MTITPESLRADLGKVAQGQSATADATAALRKAAGDRMEEVDARLAELRPKALTGQVEADEYLHLTEERGTLAMVLGDAG